MELKTSTFLLSNSSGEKSITSTAFLIGFLVATAKFLVSGLVIMTYTFPVFSGADYALALSAVGGIYVLNKRFTSTNTGSAKGESNE